MAKKRKQIRVRFNNAADKAYLEEAVRQQTEKQLNAAINNARMEIADRFIDIGMAALGNAMIDIFDVKGATLKAIIDKWVLQFECLAGDYCSLDDLFQYIESEGGVRIERRCQTE